jgi:hypothetical protein
MAVTQEARIHWYVGLSTDDKPETARAGSRFFEFDTPAWFVFDGTDWQDQTPS